MRIILIFEKFLRFTLRCWSLIIYRCKGLKCFSGSYFGLGIRFNHPSRISLGAKLSIADGARMWCENKTNISRLKFGDHVQINRDVVLDFTGDLQLGDRVLISEGAILYTHSHGYDPRSVPTPGKLIVEEDVWIGTRALVLPSVNSIGARSIIGAGAIISKDVPSDSIVVAQPQRTLSKTEVE